MTSHRIVRSMALLLLTLCASSSIASASVYLNEIRIHGDEAVELYNASSETVDLSEWKIVGTHGEYELPDDFHIIGESYVWISGLNAIMSDLGGETSVIDLTNEDDDLIDRVYYGQQGGAPVPPDVSGATIARAPDASLGAPAAADPETDCQQWAITLNPTPAAFNVTRTPSLGTSLRIGDVALTTGAVTRVDLHNPSGSPIYIGGWYLTAGAGGITFLPPFTVPAGYTVGVNVPGTFDTHPSGLVYLHKLDGTRLDQKDGELTNGARQGPPPVVESSWGNVKAAYR